jgi:hypothetical protein
MEKGYGRGLAWLDSRGLLDAQIAPGDRITPDRVRAYVDHLEAENASWTVIARIIELKVRPPTAGGTGHGSTDSHLRPPDEPCALPQ